MTKLINKLASLISSLIIAAIVIYAFAWIGNFLPEKYMPEILFDESYADLKVALAKDAKTDSWSSGISRYFSDQITAMEKSHQQQLEAEAAAEAANEGNDPMSKAKKAVQEYENKMDEQKEMLDNL